MSFRTMITLRSEWPRLLSASYAMPPVIEPSPITATMWRRSGSAPLSRATASPYAYDRIVEAWLFSTKSCSDSSRLG